MTAADDSRAGSWQAWANDVAAAWRLPGHGAGEDALSAALAGFARFAESVASAGGAGVAAHDFAMRLEQLAAALPVALDGEWFSLPFTWSAAWPGAAAEEALDNWLATTTRWYAQGLDLPALGPQREWLEAGAAVQRARLREQRAGTALARHYRAAIARALTRFAAWLRDDDPPAVTSLRALFDAWVDIADAAYREQVMQADFSTDFGAHVNAMSERRAAEQALARRLADAAGLPHRAALDKMAEQHAALRREIDALRAELARLRAPAPVPTPTAREAGHAGAARAAPSAGDAAHADATVDAPARSATPAKRKPAVANASKRRPPRERGKSQRSTTTAARKPAREHRDAGGEFDIERILQQEE